ncbi:MAG TPA: M3 family oligoendopeptidase [Candidatus Limiplasma sp.]|nr:M3 family oligoendopeptidase [Candidatus Limiplasma sp.]
METTWDLSVIYQGFDDPALAADLEKLATMSESGMAILQKDGDAQTKLLEMLAHLEAYTNMIQRTYMYCELSMATDAEDQQAFQMLERVSTLSVDFEVFVSACKRYIGSVENLKAIIAQTPELKKNDFALLEAGEQASHMMDESMERWMLRMSLSGGDSFSKLRDQLIGTLTVEMDGESYPLPAIRGMAYDPDPVVRKKAYEAEMAAYKKIALPMAFCLGGIKGEALTMCEAKHYPDILTQQLAEARMDHETLDAMWSAIREALPDFRRYLKAKAKLLGHKGGLPFYDLFAPVGKSTKKYTIEEARDLIIDTFNKVHPKMAAFMAHAFDNRWIDVYPKQGKTGGAFCSDNHELQISRVLTNFMGSFSDVSTLAHELGHAWHGECSCKYPLLMTQYPMPLAETASTFNETMLAQTVLETADEEMAFSILEGSLMEDTQCMVDIYSRFLFETAVFEARKTHTPSPDELRKMTIDAQKETYGDGLDPEVLHPDMWINKCHYYMVGLHFYNFPYAFGLLFGLSVYQKFKQEGPSFMPKYDEFLGACGSDTIANVAKTIGIDVRSIDTWRTALDVFRGEIDTFVKLVDQRS